MKYDADKKEWSVFARPMIDIFKYIGPCPLQEDVWSKQSADHSHRFWHGLENPVASVTREKVKQGGKITAMLKLLPVVKPTFKRFPEVLKEMGYENLIVHQK